MSLTGVLFGALVGLTLVSSSPPNILFLIDESTEGSAYFFGENAPMPIPNLQSLMKSGVSFTNAYVAAPVCCPSRATIISGRHAHKIGHYQQNPATGLWVDGAWNNHEGLPSSFNSSYMDVLKANGYVWNVFGKTDWYAGGHSVSCRVTSWTNKVNFPYTLNSSFANGYGWFDESGPIYDDENTTNPNATKHSSDWNNAYNLAEWITEQSSKGLPWYVQFSPLIVHPPYSTTTYWLDQINTSMITIPQWEEVQDMHYEDFQASMKKRMLGPCCSKEYIKSIRQHYYANVAEYDAMVGVILQAVKDAGVMDNTWIIATSDHGDLNMEHRQYYKMSWYEGSSRVPLIISGGSNFNTRKNIIESHMVSSLDFYPTILTMANIDIPNNISSTLDGYNILPFVLDDTKNYSNIRPNYIMSQFHGDEIHLSWYMLRKDDLKYITYGSGYEFPCRLFNLTNDTNELIDLCKDSKNNNLIKQLNNDLLNIIQYPSVSANVEAYNKDSFAIWKSSFNNYSDYVNTVSNLRWNKSWSFNPNESLNEIEIWLNTPNDTFTWSINKEIAEFLKLNVSHV